MLGPRAIVILSTAALSAACATTRPEPEPAAGAGPSIIEYIPVKRYQATTNALPKALPAMLVRADDDGDAKEAFASSVRYEPIAVDSPPPDAARLVPAIDDDGEFHGDSDAPNSGESDVEAVEGGDDPSELAEEDRPTTRPGAREKVKEVVDADIYAPKLMPNGIVVPYPLKHVFRGFGPCIGKRHHHEAIDIGGVGPDWGVGTPIHAMAAAEVVFIGRGASNPDDFGLPDRRAGDAQRGDRLLPRSARIEPYGDVYFFTRKKGRWRSGNILITRATEGPLAGHTIRYLHIAAIHPDVKVGGTIEAGQEIALMGGTGVQESAPHLHLDIEAPDGRRLDVAEVFGLGSTATCKGRAHDEEAALAAARAKKLPTLPPASTTKKVADSASKTVPRSLRDGPDEGGDDAKPGVLGRTIAVPACGVVTSKDDFGSGRYRAHAVTFEAKKGDKFAVELARKSGLWKPKLLVDAPKKAVTVKWLGTGQAGKRAYAVIEAKKAGPVRLEVTAWDAAEPPKSAAYALHVAERCARRKIK